MKVLSLLAGSPLPLSASPENSLIPSMWFQEITATDGSAQQCIIFTTVPGAAEGAVVSWASLDHGSAVRYLITATMATEWDDAEEWLFVEQVRLDKLTQ